MTKKLINIDDKLLETIKLTAIKQRTTAQDLIHKAMEYYFQDSTITPDDITAEDIAETPVATEADFEEPDNDNSF